METFNIQPSLLMIKWGPVGNPWLRQADLKGLAETTEFENAVEERA